MTRARPLLIATLSAASLAFVGCREAESASASAASDAPSWVLASAPADASSVTEIKANAAEGDEVVLRARIGGRKQPIDAGSPVFVVMDLSIPHCGEIPGDSCGTPWDYCCETPESIMANAATIRVPGEMGPAAAGFAPLDEVIVVGTVGPRPADNVLTVDAAGVYRVSAGD